MSDRLSDEQVAQWARYDGAYDAAEVSALAREVREWRAGHRQAIDAEVQRFVLQAAEQVDVLQALLDDARRRLAAIRALPDELDPDDDMDWTVRSAQVYAAAMRQVKALLDGES